MAKRKSARRSSLSRQSVKQKLENNSEVHNTEVLALGFRDPSSAQPENIKRFVEQRPYYERLCIEISYALRTAMEAEKIIFASVTERAKTLESFLEKNTRKQYRDPFEVIEDFASVRVVCLYQDDLPLVEGCDRKPAAQKTRVFHGLPTQLE